LSLKRRNSAVIRAAAAAPGAFAIVAAHPIELIAASMAEGQTPRFEIEAYNGGTLRVAGFKLPVIVDLASAKFVEHQLPILFAHDGSTPVGHAENRVNDGKSIKLAGLLSVPSARTNEIIAAHKSGYRWQASIGARDFKSQAIGEGQSVNVNGRRFVGPVIVARGATIYETSILPIGADSSTSVSIAAQAATPGGMQMTFEEWLESLKLVKANLGADQIISLQAAFDAQNTLAASGSASSGGTQGGSVTAPGLAAVGAPAGSQTVQAGAAPNYREQLAADIEFANSIRATAAEYGASTIEVGGKQVDLVTTALRDNWTLDKVRFEAMRHQMSQHSQRQTGTRGPAIIVAGRSNPSEAGTVLEACLARQFSFKSEELEATYSAEVLEAADHRRFRAFSLHQLMDEVISAAGHHFSGSRKSNDFINAAAAASNELQASGTTTMSLTNIFENVLNKTLLAQFNRVETVWSQICGTRNLNDFKAAGMYRLDASGGFRKVAPDGELKHIGMTDSKSTVQADTYGLILGLTRQDIINDDLGALDQKATIIGRLGARSVEEAVFKLLLANTGSFFHADNKNLITNVLDFAGLEAGIKTFGNMVDSSGGPILVPPKLLLTGTTLAQMAKSLYTDTEYGVGTSSKAQERVKNTHVGLYTPVKTPYIDNTAIKDVDGAAISNQSATQWYLMADPQDMPAIIVGFLNGRQVPIVESSESSFNTLGFQTRAYFDYGVAFGPDEASAVKSTGAG
jgi:hypothetical protein